MRPIVRNLVLGAVGFAMVATVASGALNFTVFAQVAAPSASTPLPEAAVKALQEALSKQGIAVKADGVWGDDTRAAVRKYQSQHHLPVTGEPDKATLDKLGVAGQRSEASGGPATAGVSAPGMMGMMGGMAGKEHPKEMGPGMMSPDMMQMMRMQDANPRLKIGTIAMAEGGEVTAEIVTVDGSLVQKLAFNRYPGFVRALP